MILRQDQPAANPAVRAGAANNGTKDWLTQISQHFRPLAQKADGDIIITAIKIVPEQNYAIIISIGDPDLSGEPERNHGYTTQQLDTVLRDEPKAADYIICYCGHRMKPMLKTAAVVAAACALGITLLEGTLSGQAAGAALMGGMAAAAWHVIPRKIKMDKMHDAAVELLRQFKPHGPPPDELERYLTDPNSGTAIIYRKL